MVRIIPRSKAKAKATPKPEVVVKYKPYPVYPFPGVRAAREKLNVKRVLEYEAWTKGFGGKGSGGWTALLVGLFVVRQLKKQRGSQFATRDVLKPGEGLVIRTIAPETRGQRRAARRAS